MGEHGERYKVILLCLSGLLSGLASLFLFLNRISCYLVYLSGGWAEGGYCFLFMIVILPNIQNACTFISILTRLIPTPDLYLAFLLIRYSFLLPAYLDPTCSVLF